MLFVIGYLETFVETMPLQILYSQRPKSPLPRVSAVSGRGIIPMSRRGGHKAGKLDPSICIYRPASFPGLGAIIQCASAEAEFNATTTTDRHIRDRPNPVRASQPGKVDLSQIESHPRVSDRLISKITETQEADISALSGSLVIGYHGHEDSRRY